MGQRGDGRADVVRVYMHWSSPTTAIWLRGRRPFVARLTGWVAKGAHIFMFGRFIGFDDLLLIGVWYLRFDEAMFS